jgi:hypothetical protein
MTDLIGEVKEEGQRISISVALDGSGTSPAGKASNKHWFIGNIYVSGKTKWEMLDDLVGKVFKASARRTLLRSEMCSERHILLESSEMILGR